jgi:hypothetical protein
MRALEALAEKYDCQVWIEIVDGSGKVGFVIENGEVKNQYKQKQEEELEEF